MNNTNNLIDLIKTEHNERKTVIYNLVKDFQKLATDNLSSNNDDDFEDDFEDEDDATMKSHKLNVISDSIKDLLQVGIKNDELIVKLIDIQYKYNKNKKSEEEDDEDSDENASNYENDLINQLQSNE